MSLEALADAWLDHDRAGARDADESRALTATHAIRHWILERWHESRDASADVLAGFGQLGRALAYERVSCASALRCVRSFAAIAPAASAEALDAARSALADTFVEARLDAERIEQRARFDAAWVEIGAGVAAIVADPPTDDPDWLQTWADRLTRSLLRRKIRGVHLGVSGAAREVLLGALSLVDIRPIEPTTEPSRKGWRSRLGW